MSEAVLLEEARADLERAAETTAASGVSFSSLTTIGCGGPAGLLIEAESSGRLAALLKAAATHELPWFVLGLGSNLLVADAGWPGVVIRLAAELSESSIRENKLIAGGGAALSRAAREAAAAGLSGLEPLAGIPGTVGGAAAMNAGAFGAAIGDFVLEVEVCRTGGTAVLGRDEIGFGYRTAGLPPDAVVSRVTLALTPKAPAAIAAAADEFRARRRESQPLGKRSCGSVFKNPPGDASAGELLDRAGCKGMTNGGAEVSSRHANFIINKGGARTADVIDLMNKCRRRVYERFGMALEPEVRLMGDIGLEPLS